MEIIHIGKEATYIDGERLDGGNSQVFRNVEKVNLKIIGMRQCAMRRGWGLIEIRDGEWNK